MHKLIGFGVLAAIIESAVLVDSSVAHAQIEGALQYPPQSIGEDAQPPPPARTVPQPVSPRQTELGVSGSSQLPGSYPNRVNSHADSDRLPMQLAPRVGASPLPPPTSAGN
jgi:hypothetical protein